MGLSTASSSASLAVLERFIKGKGNTYVMYFVYKHTVFYILVLVLHRARSLMLFFFFFNPFQLRIVPDSCGAPSAGSMEVFIPHLALFCRLHGMLTINCFSLAQLQLCGGL